MTAEKDSRGFHRLIEFAEAYIDDPFVKLGDALTDPAFFIQMGVIGLSLLLAFILSRRCAALFSRWRDHSGRNLPLRSNLKPREFFFLLIGCCSLWFGVAVLTSAGLVFLIVKIVASLASAWCLIRLTSSTIKSNFWSRLIAAFLWLVAALSILGLLQPVSKILDSVAIHTGTIRISPLLLIKGIVIFGVLLWMIGIVSRILERSFNAAAGLTSSQRVLFFKLSNLALYGAAIFVGLNIIGLDLTALAVFGGALGLGIGFGLQKIFSNLISGIILLIDKSVKPGDVIAVGDTYGWVNSLGARYVSVLTRDGKEHLIPNENLISEKVENWSYSDTNIRIHVPIGVGYDADIHLVRDLILQAANDAPRVLKDRPPGCLLKEFGDNSVNFELRCWIADPQQGVSNIKSELYFRIWDLFKQNRIEIPFPQRDVHLKIDDDLRGLIQSARAAKPTGQS